MLNRSVDKRTFLRVGLWSFTALVLPSALSARDVAGDAMPWQPGAAQPPQPPLASNFFTPAERAIADAALSRLIPSDETGPGAREAGVIDFIDQQLAGYYGRGQRWFMHGPFPEPLATQGYQFHEPPAGFWRAGLAAMERHCNEAYSAGFAALPPETQDAVLQAMEDDEVVLEGVPAAKFFAFMREMAIEGFFCDPVHGGNRDMIGWHLVGFPGARYDYRDFLHHNGAAITMPPVGLMGRPGWSSE